MKSDRIHLKAPQAWINDPNGFIYYKGMYHLFYQHFPYAPEWGTMHWGHAVSKNLVDWEHQGIALFPTRYEDQNGCFSGCAVEEHGQMYIYYTGVHYLEPDPANIHRCKNSHFESSQMMIVSRDGYVFDNFHGKQVIVPPVTDKTIGHIADTRDPKVWRGKNGWYMVLGSRNENGKGKLLFYKSEDLKTWSFVNDLTEDAALGWMWECPDYFETEGGNVLMLSVMGLLKDPGLEENHTVCCLADFEEETCTMKMDEKWQFFDYGLDLYAPQSTADENGRRVLTAWARMPEPVDGAWNGMFCIPRVVSVEHGHIYFRVHPNVERMYQRPIASPAEADEAGYKISIRLMEGETLDVGGYRIFRRDGRIHTDRTAVLTNPEKYRTEFSTPDVRDGEQSEIYVDRNLVEVFINHGEYAITNVVYGLGDEIFCDSPEKMELYTLQ